jgi:hypothetical protein
MPLPNPLQPLTDFIASLQPVFDFIRNLAAFVINQPILSVIIISVALFLVTGLLQTIVEWSRKFWDNIFLYSAKSVQFILKSIGKLVLSIFTLVKQRFLPNPDKNI